MVDLYPMNKNIVVKNIDEENKTETGIIMSVRNDKQYRTAIVVSVADCDETKNLKPNDVVLYDTIGAVDHRIGNQMFTTVRALNVVALVVKREETV